MAEPIPHIVAKSGDVDEAPAGAIPIALYGVEAGGEGGDVEVAWADVTGKPTDFPPATHTHAVADVTGLQGIINDLTDRITALETAAGEA